MAIVLDMTKDEFVSRVFALIQYAPIHPGGDLSCTYAAKVVRDAWRECEVPENKACQAKALQSVERLMEKYNCREMGVVK